MGYAVYPLGATTWVSGESKAWIWGITLIACGLTVGIDLNRNEAAFWLVTIVAIWMLGLWLRDAKGITIFGEIYNFFANLDADYSCGLGFFVSIWLTIPFLLMFLWSRINDKWRFTHNEFEHRSFGKVDWSAARAAKTVRTSYPDLMEAVFCLAGDLIIYDARGSRVIRRIPHVPLLPLVRKKINIVLQMTAVTEGQLEDDQDAAAEGEEESNGGNHVV